MPATLAASGTVGWAGTAFSGQWTVSEPAQPARLPSVQAYVSAELAGKAGVFDQPPPSFAAPELLRYFGSGGQRAIPAAVGQCPLPGLPLKYPATSADCPSRRTAIAAARHHRIHVV